MGIGHLLGSETEITVKIPNLQNLLGLLQTRVVKVSTSVVDLTCCTHRSSFIYLTPISKALPLLIEVHGLIYSSVLFWASLSPPDQRAMLPLKGTASRLLRMQENSSFEHWCQTRSQMKLFSVSLAWLVCPGWEQPSTRLVWGCQSKVAHMSHRGCSYCLT